MRQLNMVAVLALAVLPACTPDASVAPAASRPVPTLSPEALQATRTEMERLHALLQEIDTQPLSEHRPRARERAAAAQALRLLQSSMANDQHSIPDEQTLYDENASYEVEPELVAGGIIRLAQTVASVYGQWVHAAHYNYHLIPAWNTLNISGTATAGGWTFPIADNVTDFFPKPFIQHEIPVREVNCNTASASIVAATTHSAGVLIKGYGWRWGTDRSSDVDSCTYYGGGGGGGGGGGSGTNCRQEYVVVEVLNTNGHWEVLWEGYATVCE